MYRDAAAVFTTSININIMLLYTVIAERDHSARLRPIPDRASTRCSPHQSNHHAHIHTLFLHMCVCVFYSIQIALTECVAHSTYN